MADFTFFLPLTKADEEKRLVWGRAAVEEPDKSREIMDYVSAKPEFHKWSDGYAKATMGKSFGNIRAMHNPKHLAGKVAELVYNDDAKAIDICVKVLDPVDWAKVEEGGYTGFSIGGGYVKKWADQASGCTRYTPRIQEISFVDSPCIPSARIMEMQKQDGTTAEVLLKGTPRTFAELIPPPTFGELRKVAAWKPLVSAGAGGTLGGAASSHVGSSETGRSIGQSVGGLGGEVAGAALGSMVGMPTIGAGVGGAIGSFGGGAIGGLVGPSDKKPKAPKQPKPAISKADGFHPVAELRERFRQDLGAATDAYRHPRRRLRKAIRAPKAKGFRALRTGQRLPGIHFGSRHGMPPAAAMPATAGSAIMQRAARPQVPPAASHSAVPAGGFIKKGHVVDETLVKAGAYDVGASGGSAEPTADVTAPSSLMGGAKRTRTAAAAPLASPSIGGGVSTAGAPSMAAPSYMTKRLTKAGIGAAAVHAGLAMGRHLAQRVGPKYAVMAARHVGARAGYEGARRVGEKLASRMVARNKRLGISGLTGRQKKVLYGTGMAGMIGGAMTAEAIGHHATHAAHRKLNERFGRPRGPQPFAEKSAVPGTKLKKQGFMSLGTKPNPPGIGKPGTFKGRRGGIFGKAAYEGSPEDLREDKRGARRLGLTLKRYERTAQDRREDSAGERRLGKANLVIRGSLGGLGIGAGIGALTAAQHDFKQAPRHTLLHHVGGLALFGPSYVGYRAGRAIGQMKPTGRNRGTELIRHIAATRKAKATKQEPIGRLQKNILLQDDNTVSQWRQARSDQWGPRPFWQTPKDTNDPKQVTMPGFPEQAYGESTGGLFSSMFGKGEHPYGQLAKKGFPPTPSSPEAREKIHQTLHEFKHGKLHSFRADRPKSKMPKVQNRKQAIAIALSQARRIGKGEDGLIVAALADRLVKARDPEARRQSIIGNVSHDVLGTVGAGVKSVVHSAMEARQGGQMHQLSPKQREQRVAAAKARWRKDMGHVDMERHHAALEDWANHSILGRKSKLARVRQEAEHFWHNAADAHAAYDKMRPHVEKKAAIIMKIPHSGGMVHNPDNIGPEHFTRFGTPTKEIYLMHPDEVDDWIGKYGKGVNKVAPPGEIKHYDELAEELLKWRGYTNELAHGLSGGLVGQSNAELAAETRARKKTKHLGSMAAA